MSKIYLFCALLLASFCANAQTTTTIYSTGTTGDFTTGHTTSTTATSGAIWSDGSTPYHGWAVFTLPTIPAGAQITSVVIGFNVTAYGGSGTPSGWNTYGYVGNLSTLLSTPGTLYSDCTAGTLLSSASYGTATGNRTLASTAAADTFVAHHSGAVVSICFTGGGTRQYKITGLGGTSATTGTHAPYLQITYCTAPTGVYASASPATLCAGSTLTLTGAATGATSYAWSGPGSYSSASLSPSFTTTTANSGIYTLTATNTCGSTAVSVSATTGSISVSTPPTPITGTTTVCAGNNTALADGAAGGTWSITPITSDIISSSGVVTAGTAAGTATVTYTTPGCTPVTTGITVTTTPTLVTAGAGPSSVCAGSTVTLSGSASGATGYIWNGPGGFTAAGTSPSLAATLANSGIFTLTATNTCGGSQAMTTVTVNPIPPAITGPLYVCSGTTNTLNDALAGGTWTSGNLSVATIPPGPGPGAVHALIPGTSLITYSVAGCSVTATITVGTPPLPITGITNICPGGVMVISDLSGTGTWSSSNPLIASVSPVTGVVAAYTTGTTTISYTTSCGSITLPLVVNNPPAPITGSTTFCSGRSVSLSDATAGGTWHSANFAIATVDETSGVVTGVSGGSILITYTTGPACVVSTPVYVTPSVPVSVSVSANPGLSSCSGVAVGYTATPLNGGTSPTYNWLVGSTIMDTGASFTYTPVNGDQITCELMSNAVCPLVDTAFDHLTMTVNPNLTPVVTITMMPNDSVNYIGQVVTFFAAITYGGPTPSIQWYSNGTAVPGATTNTYAPHINSDATVYCKVTSDAPCANPVTVSSNQVKIYATYLGVNDLTGSTSLLSVYPNPNQGSFTIHSDRSIVNGLAEITDISGRSVYHTTITGTEIELSYPEILQGLYLLKVTGTDFAQTVKLVIQK